MHRNSPVAKQYKCRTHVAAEREPYEEQWDVLREDAWGANEIGMESFGTLDRSGKTIVIPVNGWWPQTAKQDEDKVRKKVIV